MKINQLKLVKYLCKRWYSLAIPLLVLLCASFLLFGDNAQALTTVPTKTNFQGRLTNSAGNIMPDGTYNMKFRLFTVGSGGSSVWSEDRLVSATQGVTVTNGLFSVKLGDVTTLPASLFASGALYLEVELPTPGTATSASPSWTEGPMTPRNQLATSAYAYNSETLDGLDSTDFAAASGSANYIQNTTTPQAANISIVGPASSSAVLSVTKGSSTGNLVVIGNGSTTGLSVDSSGNTSVYGNLTVDTNTLLVDGATDRVGIGTAPLYKLHVADTSTASSGTNIGSLFGLTVTPSSAPGAVTTYEGVYAAVTSSSANLNANSFLYGAHGIAQNSGSATAGGVIGVNGQARNTGGGGITTAIGTYGSVSNLGAGTIATGAAFYAGTSTAPAGSITNAYGLLIAAQNGTGITNSYGIYQQGASDLNHFSGATTVNNTSSSAFSINNASAAKFFVADTSASRIYIGDPSADATGVVLVLDTKNNAGDPTGVDGAMYYNSSMRSFRCHQNGVWRSCLGGLAYANTAPSTTISGTGAETAFSLSHSIPANSCQTGRVYRVTARGVISTYTQGLGNPGAITIRIKVGGTTVGTAVSANLVNTMANRGWQTDFNITCADFASNSVEGQGATVINTTASAAQNVDMANSAAVTVPSLASAQDVTITADWVTSNAGNAITLRQLVVEELGP